MLFVDEVLPIVISTNLVDAQIEDWDETKSYAKGDEVYFGNYVYRSRADSNKGNPPLYTPLKWAIAGIKNSIAVWDRKYIHLKSYAQDKIEFLVDAPFADTVVFGGVVGVNVSVEQYKKDVLYQTYNDSVVRWRGSTFKEYVFEPFDRKEKAIIHLDPLIAQKLKITINNPGGVAECSYIVIGKKYNIGKTLPSGSVGIVDFSKKKRSDDGVIYLKRGKIVDEGNFTVLMQNKEFDMIRARLKKIVGKPTVFIPTCKQTTIMIGYIKDFSVSLDGDMTKQYNLNIEEI